MTDLSKYVKCKKCQRAMVGIVAGPKTPARDTCSPCGGKPLSATQREERDARKAA